MSAPPLLLLGGSSGWGGLEMFSVEYFELLHQVGVPARFLVQADSPTHRRLMDGPAAADVEPRRIGGHFDFRLQRDLRRRTAAGEIELVHTFKSSDVFHPALAGRPGKGRPKLVHHLQMLPSRSRRDPLHRLVYSRIDRLITLTDQMRGRVAELWPIASDRLRTVHYGLANGRPGRATSDSPEGGRDRARERFNLPANRTLIGLAGQVCEIKGQQFVLEVFARLAEQRPDLDLVFVGSAPPGEEAYDLELKRRCTELGLDDRVHHLGFCAEMAELFPAFDLFVLGSRAEAFGRVLLEALAAGNLVVASAAGGVPEIIEDGATGWLYTSRDADDLARVLLEVLSLPAEQQAAVREQAQQSLTGHFTLDRFLDQVFSVYEELIPFQRPVLAGSATP